MYVTTALSEACPNLLTSFSSAERDITENDSAAILTILGGPSPWQRFLQRNLASHRRTLPAKPIRVCDEGEFASGYRSVFGEPASANAQGFVNRRAGKMVLKEFPLRNYGKSKLGIVLHEAVHLFSHPPGKSSAVRGTAYDLLGRGLLEGLTQIVTDDILSAQCISPLRSDWQAYKNLTPVARRFVQIFTPALVADAYFNGNLDPLRAGIRVKWTWDGFQNVRQLTNHEQTQIALRLIDRLNQPRVTHLHPVFRGQRPGTVRR